MDLGACHGSTPDQKWEFQAQRFAAESVSWYKNNIIKLSLKVSSGVFPG
jgi:hypothetical protein